MSKDRLRIAALEMREAGYTGCAKACEWGVEEISRQSCEGKLLRKVVNRVKRENKGRLRTAGCVLCGKFNGHHDCGLEKLEIVSEERDFNAPCLYCEKGNVSEGQCRCDTFKIHGFHRQGCPGE